MIEIGGRKVGWGYKPIISAELGVNHQNDLKIALKMIDAAAEAGVDSVKLQYLKVDDFCTDKKMFIIYKQHFQTATSVEVSNLEGITENYYNFFKRHEISLEFVSACRARANEHGLIFGVTPTSAEGVVELVGLTDYYKIAADMVIKKDMMAEMHRERKRNIPIIVSLGHCDIEESIPSADIHLHCVSEYPAKYSQLWKIKHLQEQGFLTGYSDHTIGIESAVRATELGAVWIECHVTLAKSLPGPDHWFSKDFDELKRLCEAIG